MKTSKAEAADSDSPRSKGDAAGELLAPVGDHLGPVPERLDQPGAKRTARREAAGG